MLSAAPDTDCRRADRADLRLPVELDATLLHGGCTLPVRVQDLSRGGAALLAPVPPPKGAPVTLALGVLTVPARVAWTDGGRFGLHFARSLRATDVFLFSSRSRRAAA